MDGGRSLNALLAGRVAQQLIYAQSWRQAVEQRRRRCQRGTYDFENTQQEQKPSEAQSNSHKADNRQSTKAPMEPDALESNGQFGNRRTLTLSRWKGCFGKIFQHPVDANQAWYKTWLLVVSSAYLYNFLTVIARFSFHLLDEQFGTFFVVFNYLSDVVYLFDLYVIVRLVYLNHGLPVTDRKQIFHHNARTKLFQLATVASVPVDHLFNVVTSTHFSILLRLNRLLLFRRVAQFVHFAETQSRRPNLFRTVQLMIVVYGIFHWATCFYFLISLAYGLESDTWVYNSERILDVTYDCSNATCWQPADSLGANQCLVIGYPTLMKHYLLSFYWAVLMLISVGEQPFPIYIGQYIFTICNIVAGTLILAALIGNVRIVYAGINQQRTRFLTRLDAAKSYMKVKRVDPAIKRRIISWFNYVWEQKHTVDESTVMDMLPLNLRSQVAINLHMSTLQKARLFQDCDPGLLAEMAIRLKLEVFNAGDYVCRKGEIGKDMYIVRKGVLNVVAEDGQTVFVTLSEGCVFGELSILDIPGNRNGNKRTTSVRSVGFSELFVLSKSDLMESLQNYPGAKRLLLEKGKDILRKDNLLIEKETLDVDTFDYVQEEYDYECLNRLSHSIMAAKRRLAELNMKVKRECDSSEQRVIALEEKCKVDFCTVTPRHPLPMGV